MAVVSDVINLRRTFFLKVICGAAGLHELYQKACMYNSEIRSSKKITGHHGSQMFCQRVTLRQFPKRSSGHFYMFLFQNTLG